MSTTPEPRRLILISGGSQEYWEPFVASIAGDFELSIIGPDYPTWQAKYVDKHRIANITNFTTLFAAVADLRGEVADAAVLTWEEGSAPVVARIAERLRMRSMSADVVRAAASRSAAAASDGVELRAYGVARNGKPDVVCVVRTGGSGPQVLASWRDEPWAGRLDELVREAFRETGADWGLTTTRLAVAGTDLRLIGLTTWLDEDELPVLNGSPAGTRLAKASSAVLFDPEPALVAS